MTTIYNHSWYQASTNELRYYYYDAWEFDGDLRVRKYPFMDGGPWKMLLLIAVYLLFVKVIGPNWMTRRQPLNILSVIFWYNVFMVALNGFFFVCAVYYTRFGLDCWTCIDIEKHDRDSQAPLMYTLAWVYVMSKVVDLVDTVFFVLRKKFDHVSTLHVFHHAVMPLNCWMGLKYVPTVTVGLMPVLNSFIHFLMYGYYALATLGPKVRPYLWWKKHLTMLQIIQLTLIVIHIGFLMTNCNLPKAVLAIAMPQVILMIVLFSSFFIKSYLKPDDESKKLA